MWCDIVTISSQGYQPTRHLPPLLGSDGGLFLLSPRRFSFSKQTIFIWTSWLKCGPHMSLYRKWKSSPFEVVRITICCSTDCLDNWLCAVVGGTIVTLIPKQKLNSAKFISILCFWQGNYILRSFEQYISIGRKPETSVLRKSFSKSLYFRGVILTRLRQYPRHIRVVTSRSQISARGEGQEKSASVNCCTVLCNAVYSVYTPTFPPPPLNTQVTCDSDLTKLSTTSLTQSRAHNISPWACLTSTANYPWY